VTVTCLRLTLMKQHLTTRLSWRSSWTTRTPPTWSVKVGCFDCVAKPLTNVLSRRGEGGQGD
jgi:hypothetical protein